MTIISSKGIIVDTLVVVFYTMLIASIYYFSNMDIHNLNILIVDDDTIIGPVVSDYLESQDLDVTLIQDSSLALNAVKKGAFDVCLLDVKMPGKTGFEIAEEIHEVFSDMPIIFLTGESGKADKIKGLRLGADDYITKPFNLEELHLRILAVTRRSKKSQNKESKPEQYAIGTYTFRPSLRKLQYGNEEQSLTAIETELLCMFCEAENGIIDREVALKKIWKDEHMFKGRSLNVYVSKLREYLSKDNRIEILNIHGKGYNLIVK